MKRIFHGGLAGIWLLQAAIAQSGLEPVPLPEVPPKAGAPAAAEPTAQPVSAPTAVVPRNTPAAGPEESIQVEVGKLPKMPVSLEFYQEDVRNVIDALARISGINMIPSDDVTGTVTFRIDKEPFDQAFQQLMRILGLVPQRIGDHTLRILTPAQIQKEAASAVTVTEKFTLQYAKAEEIQKIIDAQRASEGRKGTSQIFQPNNTLIITDTPEGMEKIRGLIQRLDTAPEQVLIEAKIVEFNGDISQEVGVEWSYAQDVSETAGGTKKFFIGGSGSGGPDPGVAAGAVAGNTFTGGALDTKGRGFGGTGVSLPTTGSPFGAFSLGFFRSDKLLLSARLTALATQGKAKTLSTPRITTVNNEEAKILIGQKVPFLQTTVTPTGSTQSTQFIDVGIKLTVKPTINANGRVRLQVKPEVSTARPDPSGAGPLVNTREAQTTVLVQSGETIVIGGLLTDDETESIAKVPLFGDIPVLGEFFKRRGKTKRRTELVVFLTPTVLATP